jgi:hypothetical protein
MLHFSALKAAADIIELIILNAMMSSGTGI